MPEPVLLLITTLDHGGAEHVVRDLCARLDRDRFSPVVAALDARGLVAEEIRQAGTEVVDLCAYSRWDWGVIWRVRRLLREKNIRLLHTHLLHATVVGRLAARPLELPVVSTCHIVERRPVRWHFWLNRWTARWGVLETCVSDAAMHFQQEMTGLPASFFRRIYNGIDLNRYQASESDEADTGSGRQSPMYQIGALGRFDRQKGFDNLLRALTKPPLASLPVECVFGGYGTEEASLKSLADELGVTQRVRFSGYQEDIASFWADKDLCVCPSRYEGFGLVAVEAMACGIPVVASAVDSLPELVGPGRGGQLVPPDNPDELAASIAGLLQKPELRKQMAAEAGDWAKQFALETMVCAYEAVYDEYLRKGTSV